MAAPPCGSPEFTALMTDYAAFTLNSPFADTNEHLAGYYLMNVPDLESTLKYAAPIPTASYGPSRSGP